MSRRTSSSSSSSSDPTSSSSRRSSDPTSRNAARAAARSRAEAYDLTAPADRAPAAPPKPQPSRAAKAARLSSDKDALARAPLAEGRARPSVLDTPGNNSTNGRPRGRGATSAGLSRRPEELWRHLTGSEYRAQRLATADALDRAHDAGLRIHGRGASLAVLADRLRRCGELGRFEVADLDPEDAQWVPYRCDGRLCWSCSRHRTRHLARRLGEALAEQPAGERLLLLTFTVGRRAEYGPAAGLARWRKGWRNLTRDGTALGTWWRDRVTAAVWAVEDEASPLGHHVHAHALVSSRTPIWYSVGAWRVAHGHRAEDETAGLPPDLTLREAWADALGLTARARKLSRRAEKTGDPDDELAAADAWKDVCELQVDAKPVRDPAGAGREVLKYVLKGQSPQALADAWLQVGELAAELAGRRAMATWGRWYGLEREPEKKGGDAPERISISGAELMEWATTPGHPRRVWAQRALTTLGRQYREAWRRRHERLAARRARARAREARARAREPD